ncbi:MAG: DUF11 domain-containing protein, partial [Gammaproteobacteria bacterium]|nr:DUF11 domain-containing protein [Gammaproteobacteria bacterium]
MMKNKKHNPIRLYIALAIAGLVTLYLWPSLVVAMPLTAKHQLERAWRFASDIGSYDYSSAVLKTDHPTPHLKNAGRSPHTKRITAQGMVDLPNKVMSMKLWTVGVDKDGIEVKVENGKAYGRLNAEGGWIEMENPSQVFAPGGDPLGFLLAAENIQEVKASHQNFAVAGPSFDDFITDSQNPTASSYTFDLNGVKYAEYVRWQLEGSMREQGELPPSVTLGVIAQYVDMKGTGQIWLNDDGLPVRQVINMEFPPERGALHWTENKVITTFSHWDKQEVYHQLFWAIPRLVDDPSLLTKDPFSLLPNPKSVFPSAQALTSQNMQAFGFLIGISLLGAALVVMTFTHRRSLVFYAGLSAAVITMMLVTPLINANQVQAYNDRQQAQYQTQQQELTAQKELVETQANISGKNFNPLTNPLASNTPLTIDNSLLTIDNFPNPQQRPSPHALIPHLQFSCVLTIGGDCDGDGLDDDIELYELGTNPESVDTDNDLISDKTEVEGFSQGGTHWYLDPSNPDSNGDGTMDGAACPDLSDVVTETLVTPSGSTCRNTDSDPTPDVLDYDDDGDGVPDLSDSSPLDVTGPFNHTDTQLDFNLDLNANGEPIFVDFEVRPTNPEHLYYTKNILDWPDDDTKGQWTKNSSTKFVDLDDYDNGEGDLMLNPLLEFVITYDASNPTAGLPITDSVTVGSITDYSDLSWLDTDELSKWGISVNEGETSDTLLLWAPLSVVEDDIGDSPVTWNGRMFYLPQAAQTTLGNNQTIRLVWMIEGIKDTCIPPSDSDYETYCAEASNWESSVQIMQTYYDEFYLTGLTVREDHGGKLNIIAEPSNVGNTNYDDYLWHLADSLQATYLRGQQKPGGGRFTVDDLATFATTWGVSGLNYTTKTLADQGDLATISGEDNLTILNSVHSGASVDDAASLLYVGEEETRTVLLSDDATTVSGTSVSVDLTLVDKTTSTTMRLSPFVYKGAGVWEDMHLGTYQDDYLATDLQNVFTNAQLDALVAPNSETISDYSLAQDGAISLTQGYYLALYIGLSGIVELNGTDVNSDQFVNADFTRSGEVATNLAQHMLESMQAYYADKSVVTALAAASDTTSVAANALSATFAQSQSAILLALGSARQGDISSSLSLALQELGNYYKTLDVDTSKFTDYVSLSEQFYVSTVSGLSNGWAAVYSVGKFIWGMSTVVWGMKVLQGTVGVAKGASMLSKVWNSAKFWAIVGFLFSVGVALYIFLSGDYDNQLQYSAAAVQFAFTIIVAAILAIITLIPGVGFIITGLIAAIDGIMAVICELVDVQPGSAFDTWFCNGLTGIVIRGLSLLFSDQLILVDLDKDDRLDVTFSTPTVVAKTNNDGFVTGNQLAVNAVISNTITLNKPTAGENLIILTSFSTGQLKDLMRNSSFAYYIESSEIDHHNGLEWGATSRWTNDTMTFEVSGNGLFSGAGINHSTDLYLTESFNVVGVDCAGFIGADENLTCDYEPIKDSIHNFIGADFAFDIIPGTLDEFHSLTNTGKDSYRLAWDNRFPTLIDADGDGLRSKAKGGNDPNDSKADTDDDGLSDSWEIDNGFDPEFVGGDGDGDNLTDYWEAFFGTSPYLQDTDGDGLWDGAEFYHSQSRHPYIDDDSTWTGGWLFTYDFDNNTALKTLVSASPIDADTDGDNVTDRLEFVYGYNPTVPQELNILTLNANADPIVASMGTAAYTATVTNELNSRTARGLLEAEFPVDQTDEVQTFVLTQLQKTTLNGSVTAPSVAQTTETSITLRAGVILEDPNAMDDTANLVAQYQFNETQPSTPCTGGLSNCSGESYTFDDSSGNGHDAACRKNFGGSEGEDCPVASGAYLEFQGVFESNTSANYWTPVARIEPHNDFKLDSFSMEVWVRPTSQENHPQNILNKYGDFTVGINANSMQPFVDLQNASCDQGDGTDTTINSSINLSKNQWNQVIVTYEENTDLLTIYINGKNGGSATTASCMATGLNERITIGAMDQTAFYTSSNGLRTYLTWTPPAYYHEYNYYYYGYYYPESFTFIGGLNKLQFFDDDLSVATVEDLYRKGNRTLDFRFDEPPGSTTFAESSGNGFEGTCTTGYCPQSGRPGLSDQAVYLDGNQSIGLTPGSWHGGGELLGTDGDFDYTITTWVKPTTAFPLSSEIAIFGWMSIGIDEDGHPYYGANSQNRITAATTLQTDKWQHLAWRFEADANADTGTRTIFLNGVEQTSDTGDGWVSNVWGTYAIGSGLEGWMDNLTLYSNALSTAEIQTAMKESPVLSLHLDEDLDTTSFSDEAPANNPATCSGNACPQAGAEGWMREAPVFDGNNDQLTVAADNKLNVTDFSLNMWVKPTKSKGGNQWLIRKDNSSGLHRNYSLRLQPNSMTLRFLIQNDCYNTSTGWKSMDSQGELLENQWNNVIATYDDDLNEMALYLNGALDSTHNPSYSGICTDSQPITIGEDFEGSLDEVAVFSARLSTLEVYDIYNYQSAWYDTVHKVPVIIDAEPPVVTPNIFTDLMLEPTIIAATAIDNDSHLSKVVSVNVTVTPPGGGGSPYTDPATGNGNGDWTYYFIPTVEGQYTIEFAAADTVGNEGTGVTVVNVDDTPPTVLLDGSLTGTILDTIPPTSGGADTLPLFGTVSDSGNPASGVVSNSITIDLEDWQGVSVQGSQPATGTTSTWEVDYPIVMPPYGLYDVVAEAADVAGNVLTKTIDTIALDDLAPTADVMLGSIVISSAHTTISGTVMEVPYPGNSKQLHFHFEEAAPPFADATIRQAKARCTGSACPAAGQSGQHGLAVDFDGNDVLTMVNAINPISTSFTAMAWFNVDDYASQRAILSQDDSGAGTGRTWLGVDTNGKLYSTLGGSASTGLSTVSTGQWHHAAVAYDGTKLSLYLDGTLAVTATTISMESSEATMFIGADESPGSNFNGLIDEVVIYDKAVSDEEIYDIANPLNNGIASAQIRLRHLTGASWPGVDPDGFIMHLPLDDEAGTSDFEKDSKLDFTVECTECPDSGLAGERDQAVYFDGTTQLEVSDESLFDFENEVTLAGWVKTDSFGPMHAVIASKEGAWSLMQYGDTGRLKFNTWHPIGNNPVGATHRLAGSTNIEDGQWHHVAISYDGVTKAIYLDGVLEASDTVADTVNPLLGQSDEPIWFGDNILTSWNQRAYTGYMDDMVIFERGLTITEVQTLKTETPWQNVSLASNSSNFTTWQYTVPANLEGPYDIDLRATDNLGNVNNMPNRWLGNIDNVGPRLTLVNSQIISNNHRVSCYAEDLNITTEGWICPVDSDLTAGLQDAGWFIDFFDPLTRTKSYQSAEVEIISTGPETMTACDLANNCTTIIVSATLLSEVNTILTPTNTSVFTGLNPIEVIGISRSDKEISSLEVWANGDSIYTTTWPSSTTEDIWNFDWTPPGGGVYTLTTTMANGLNEQVTDTELTTITVTGPYLTLTKTATPTTVLEPNDAITYTINLENIGNADATNILITDVLPINVVGDDLTETVSLLSPGQSVSYTIPATITNFISHTVINTAYFSETQHSGQGNAISRQCNFEFVVTTNADSWSNPPFGSLRYAVDNSCDGALITFSDDFTITISGLSINKGMTIDATGKDVNINGGESGNGIFDIDVTSPVTLTHLSIFNGGTESGNIINVGGSAPVTIQDSAIFNNETYGGAIIGNSTNLRLINTTFSSNGGDEIINNEASGVLSITHSTIVENWDGVGISNNGQMLIRNSIVAGNNGGDCTGSGTGTDGGYNLFDEADSCPATISTTQTISPTSQLFNTVLASLGSYGGDTQTFALLVGSPAIDAIPVGVNGCGTEYTSDQRGLSRPVLSSCDIGAFEAQGYVLTVTGGLSQSTYINTSFADPLEVTLTNPYSEPVGLGGEIIFTAPATGASLSAQTITASVNSSDVASATVLANGTTGSYTVTATAKGAVNSVVFSMTNLMPPVDLAISKSVYPVAALSGQPVTYTLAFSNTGSYTATGVTITDIVPIEVEQLGTPLETADAGVTITRTTGISYAWTVSDLGPGQGGLITITGQISSSLSNGTSFTNTATITASADISSTNNSASVSITADNVAPVAGPIPAQTISETHTLTFTIPTSDPNGDTNLSYALIGGATGDAALNSSTGLFSWTPGELDGPGLFTFTVMVTDSGNLTDTAEFTVTVTETNTAPVLASIPNQTITETLELTFTVQATDDDVPTQTLSFNLGSDAPVGASINSNSGLVSWTPAEGAGGNVFTFTILVTDTGSLTDSGQVQVTVISANAAPVITAGNTITVTMTEDSTPTPFDLTLYATDVDLPGDTLTWSLFSGATNGTALVGGTGLSQTIAYTPTADYHGFDSFIVQVSDGSLADTTEVRVTIESVNDQPAFAALGDQTTPMLASTTQTVTGWAHSFDYGPADEDASQSVQDFLVLVTSGTNLFSVYPRVADDGTMTFTPNGTSGTASVSVWLQDDGGVANSGNNTSDPIGLTITIPRGTEYAIIASTGTISETDSGSQPITFTVNRTGDMSVASQVEFSLDGTASYGSDFGNLGGSSGVSGLTGTISFAANEISKTITLDVYGDQFDESITIGELITNQITIDSESIILSLFNGTNMSVSGISYEANLTIVDDDTAGVLITESNSSTDVDEVGPTSDTYTLQLTSVPTSTVTIILTPDGQLDLGSGPGVSINLNFAAGITALEPQMVTVTAVDDALTEGPHTGLINHAVSSTANVYSTMVVSDVTVSILDNDLPSTVVINDVTVSEDVGTAVISITLTGRNVYGASVDYTFSDGSADSNDYSATNGTVSWTAYTSGTKTITATINDDDFDELAETVNITLSAPVNATIVNGTGVLTITDNDASANLVIAKTVELSNTPALAGEPITYTIVVSNSGGGAENVTVSDTLPAYIDGTDLDQTVTVSANQSVIFTINAVVGNNAPVGLTTITNTASFSHSSDTGQATATLVISGTAPNVAPELTAITMQSISETQALTFTVSVSDTKGDSHSYGLYNASTGMNIDNSGEFSWTPNEAQGPGTYFITVIVTDTGGLTDTTVVMITVGELNEAPVLVAIGDQTIAETQLFTLTLAATDNDLPVNSLSYSMTNAPVGATLVGDIFSWTPDANQGPDQYVMTFIVSDDGSPVLTDSETITITVNNTPSVVITESDSSTDVSEGGVTDTYQVVLDSPPTDVVTVTVSSDSQVQTFDTSVVFTPSNWSTVQTVTVNAVDDLVYEGPHSGNISHNVSSNDGDYSGLSVTGVTANISDDDALPTISVTNLTVDESIGTASISVTLSGESVYSASVAYTISDGSATGGGMDYSASNNSLTWLANTSGTQTITISIVNDTLDESDETANISLSGAISATLVSSSGVLTITDNDAAPNLSITKDVDLTNSPTQPGDTITYTIVISNSGGGTENVVVSDTLPAYINGSDLNQTVTVTANKQVTFTLSAVVDGGVPVGLTTITNTAGFSHSSGASQATASLVVSKTNDMLYLSTSRNGTVDGLLFADEDILAYDANSTSWTKLFDGSDVGFSGADLDAFALLNDGTLLLSPNRPRNLGSLGQVDDSDIVRF